MSESSKGFEPKVYVKGDDERVANSPSAAVALAFEGYTVREDSNALESNAPKGGPVTQDAPVPDGVAPAKPRPPRQSQENPTA